LKDIVNVFVMFCEAKSKQMNFSSFENI
jgi:hypothetical protein